MALRPPSITADHDPPETTIDRDRILTPELRRVFLGTPGFMPEDEGMALVDAAADVASLGPLVEIGSYCGRSTILLAAVAAAFDTHVIAVDHHRGSEEHQPGWEYHDPELVDPDVGRLETLPTFRRAIAAAGLEDAVVAVVAPSAVVATYWRHPVGMVFVDGSHTDEAAQADYEGWSPHVAPGGSLVIHDVFEDPDEGGQAPYRIYRRALDSGRFTETSSHRSLRVLRREADHA